jgi:hypothetical protein
MTVRAGTKSARRGEAVRGRGLRLGSRAGPHTSLQHAHEAARGAGAVVRNTQPQHVVQPMV